MPGSVPGAVICVTSFIFIIILWGPEQSCWITHPNSDTYRVTVSEWRFSQGAEGSTLHRTGTFLSTGYYFYYSILKGNDGNLKTVRCHRVEDASCRDLWGMCLEQHWSFSFLFSLGISRFRVKHNAASSMIQSLRISKWMDLKIKNPKQSCIFPNTNDDFYLVPGFNRD